MAEASLTTPIRISESPKFPRPKPDRVILVTVCFRSPEPPALMASLAIKLNPGRCVNVDAVDDEGDLIVSCLSSPDLADVCRQRSGRSPLGR